MNKLNTKAKKQKKFRRNLFMSSMLLPSLLCMGVVMIYPLLHALYLSLFNYKLTRPDRTRFAPLDNISRMLNDDVLHRSILNTIYFTFFTVIIGLLIGMLFALLIDQMSNKASNMRGLVMVPWVIPGVVTGYLFMYMFDYDLGIVNHILKLMGIIDNNMAWLVDVKLAMPAVIVAHVWTQVPFYMVMITAGLKAIPKDIQEAAYGKEPQGGKNLGL